MENLAENVKTVQAFVPASRSSANTLFNGAASGAASGIDTKGFETVKVIANLGTIGATTLTVTIEHSDTDDDTAAVAYTNKAGTAAAFASIVNADDDKVFVINLDAKQLKRYLFVKVVQADAVACVYQIGVELGKAKSVPVTQSQTVNFNG